MIHLCQHQYNSTHNTLDNNYYHLPRISHHLSTRLLICSFHFVTAFIDLTIIPISCLGVNWESKGLPGPEGLVPIPKPPAVCSPFLPLDSYVYMH